VELGIDRLVDNQFKSLAGARIGLVTNFSCCDSKLVPTIELFARQTKAELCAIFAPEHGLYAALQDQVKAGDYLDKKTKTRVSSLYGQTLMPDTDLLGKIDVLVIDLQDIGTRYYTFVWSAILMIKAAAALEKEILILDRPNPLNGIQVQGPVLEPGYSSFVGLYAIPVRHGLTIGELCNLINDEYRLGGRIRVIRMKGWRRRYYLDETGLAWAMPSPNMPCLDTALVYPGLCLLEGTNISEGRGTTRPFEVFGAPWIDPFDLVAAISRRNIPGAWFRPTFFIPQFGRYTGRLCKGAQIYVKDRQRFEPFSTGLEIIRTVIGLYPKRFRWRMPPYEFEKKRLPIDILCGNSWISRALENNRSVRYLNKRWEKNLKRFKRMRNKHLLYRKAS